MFDALVMLSGLRVLAIATVAAWLFFVLYMGLVALNLSRLGVWQTTIPALSMGSLGLLASIFVGSTKSHRLSAHAKVAAELMLLLVALFFLLTVMASRAG
jgi:hypothetical protein